MGDIEKAPAIESGPQTEKPSTKHLPPVLHGGDAHIIVQKLNQPANLPTEFTAPTGTDLTLSFDSDSRPGAARNVNLTLMDAGVAPTTTRLEFKTPTRGDVTKVTDSQEERDAG